MTAPIGESKISQILVIGAGSVVGCSIVGRFLDAGCLVQATYHKSAPAMPHPRCTWSQVDLLDPAQISECATRLSEIAFDVIVVAAGLLPGLSLTAYGAEKLDHVNRVNFSGPAQLIGSVLPQCAENSVVIMIASISGERGSFDPVYAAAKAGITAFVKSMAVWHTPKTRFVAVAPGLIDGSSMMDDMAPERRQHHLEATPLKRLITAGELADVIFDLQKPHWAFANGTCVRLNGGSYV